MIPILNTLSLPHKEIEARIEQSCSKEEALENAIAAVGAYMKAVTSAATASERTSLKAKCKSILARAEEIKQAKTWNPYLKQGQPQGPSNKAVKILKAPVSTRKLSAREQIILIEGSRLHGFIFPQWTADPENSSFDAGNTGGLFM